MSNGDAMNLESECCKYKGKECRMELIDKVIENQWCRKAPYECWNYLHLTEQHDMKRVNDFLNKMRVNGL